MIVRTKEEIDEVMNLAYEEITEGTKWRGQSYEEGVRATIDWMLGEIDDNPMIDEG